MAESKFFPFGSLNAKKVGHSVTGASLGMFRVLMSQAGEIFQIGLEKKTKAKVIETLRRLKKENLGETFAVYDGKGENIIQEILGLPASRVPLWVRLRDVEESDPAESTIESGLGFVLSFLKKVNGVASREVIRKKFREIFGDAGAGFFEESLRQGKDTGVLTTHTVAGIVSLKRRTRRMAR